MTEPLVVKLGGSVVDRLSSAWWDDAAAVAADRPIVIVHGWSAPVAALQGERRREPVMLLSQTGYRSRLTDAAVLDDIRTVSARVRDDIAAHLARRAVDARTVDASVARLIHARVIPQRWWVDGKLEHLDNLVGPVEHVDGAAVIALLAGVGALVVTPLATSAEHPTVNTDADRAAAHLATALGAAEMVFVTDVHGVLVDGATVRELSPSDLPGLRGQLTGGMRKKVQAVTSALGRGLHGAAIGRAPISELLAGLAGTRVRSDA
ncbi:amino acid kinase family protein [Micromonospora chersina]|uniref:amino acid kinase family protein n=1 Tax=Micromonospora chersina TaxID=47854 RepID=UPI00372173DA